MASIGDIWIKMELLGSDLVASAKREGAKAGEAAGIAMSASIKANVSAKGLLIGGAALKLGEQGLVTLEHAIGDVVNAIPDMIHQGQAFGLTVDEIVDKTNASAESASHLAGALTYLGIPTAGLGMSLKALAQDVVNNKDKFEKLGISVTDANGDALDMVTILDNVRSYMSKTTNGAGDLNLATDLLGKSAGSLVDYLALTDSQVQALNGTLDDMGVTMDEVAVKNAESLMRETNLLGLAFQGFSNLLFTEVAPTIRGVIGGITEVIKTHGAEIRETIIGITQSVLGFVTALLGIEGVTPFQQSLDSLATSGGGAALSMDQWAQQTGRTLAPAEKAKTATANLTGAIDSQIKSVDKQIERSKARDAADELIFSRTMKRLSGEYGARIDALDLAERELAIAADQRDLNEQLNEAQLALAEAQKGKAGGVDAQAVSDATAAVARIEADQAENSRQLAVDTNRARLQSTQDYIESIAALESDNADKKSLANTLSKRETALTGQLAVATEAKNATAIEDITAKLEAVKVAEARTAAALKEADKQGELEGLKAQLSAQRAAMSAAGAGESADAKAKRDKDAADYAAYLADEEEKTKVHAALMGVTILGDPVTGTGVGGAMTKAWTDGQAAGEEFRKFLTDTLGPAVQGIVDLFGAIRDTIVEIAGYSDTIGDLLTLAQTAGAGWIGLNQPNPADAPKIKRAITKYVADYKAESVTGRPPSEAEIKQYLHDQGFQGLASGAWNVERDMTANIHQGEMVVPFPAASAMRGMTGGTQVTEIPVYLDGEVLTRVVSRRQADDFRH